MFFKACRSVGTPFKKEEKERDGGCGGDDCEPLVRPWPRCYSSATCNGDQMPKQHVHFSQRGGTHAAPWKHLSSICWLPAEIQQECSELNQKRAMRQEGDSLSSHKKGSSWVMLLLLLLPLRSVPRKKKKEKDCNWRMILELHPLLLSFCTTTAWAFHDGDMEPCEWASFWNRNPPDFARNSLHSIPCLFVYFFLYFFVKIFFSC